MRIIVAPLLCAALTACATGGPDTNATQSPSPTVTQSPTPTPGLADGTHHARLAAFDAQARTVVADRVDFFTGDAAVTAAVEDGHDPGDVNNDYYVRNADRTTVTLPVTAGMEVVVNTLAFEATGSSTKDTAITHAQLGVYFARGEAQQRLFEVTVEGGVVVRLHEQYLP